MSGPRRRDAAQLGEASVTDIVCWSRMQSEAGQELLAIVGRKEAERRAGDGVFLWGVGNSPGALPARLARAGIEPPVVFSVMKSRPKPVDAAPTAVLVWRRYTDAEGRERPLPAHSIVTSRADAASGAKARHYALMCRSGAPLTLGDHGFFDPQAYRNLGGTGAPVGASQVTALLHRVAPERAASHYRVNLRALLTGELWVRLRDPALLSRDKLAALRDFGAYASPHLWCELAAWLREGPTRPTHRRAYQPALL